MTSEPNTLLRRLDALDRRVSAALVVKPRADGSPRAWLVVLRKFSEAGSYGMGWFVAFALVAGLGGAGFARALTAAACVGGMLAFNSVIKNVIRRPRPVAKAIDHEPTTYSMPSAHTSMAMVGAATMQVMLPHQAPLWWTVAIGLAISRVVLGMHYLADVLAGIVLGIACGLLVAAPLVQSVHAGW